MNRPRDIELQAYLEGHTQLSRLYQALEKVEPPPFLDDRVLRDAQLRVSDRKLGGERAWRPRKGYVWATLAAALVLSFSILPRLGNIPGEESLTRESIIRSRAPAGVPPKVLSEPRAVQEKLEAVLEENLRLNRAPAGARVPASPHSDDDPATWLEEIRALEADGQFEAARQQLEALKTRYPDYPLTPPSQLP